MAGQDREPMEPGREDAASFSAHGIIDFQGTKTQRSNTIVLQVLKRGAEISFLLAAGTLIFLEV